MENRQIGYWQLILAEFFVSLPLILVRFGKSLGNESLAFFRVAFAFIFLGIFSMFSKKYRIQRIKKERGKLIIFGALHGFIILAAFISMNLLTISSATIIQATIGIWTALFSIWILKERFNLRVFTALLISFLGMIVIVDPADIFIKRNIIGIACALFTGVFGGFIYAFSKTFKTYEPHSLTFWQNLIATPFLIPLLFISPVILTKFSLTIFILLGLCGAISFSLLYAGFKKLEGQRASALTLLYVAFSIIMAVAFFKEIPTTREILGGILILGGAYFSSK